MALCGQQDFLPFTCSHCRRVFCLEHRETAQHNCTVDLTARGKMPTCPVCSQTIKTKAEDVPDAIVNRHILSGCKSDVFDVQLEKKKIKDAKACAVPTCHNPEKFDTIVCVACGATFCLKHRHQDLHKCPKLTKGPEKRGNAAASRLLDKIAEKKAAKAAEPAGAPKPRTEKEQALAQTRLRMRAKGEATVKEHQRFYLEILFPKASINGAPLDKKPEAMWFDMNWTVGRVLEKIGTSCGVENRNHEQAAKKLQLTSVQSQAVFPHDVALNLLIPELRSGDTVQLVYT
jgi:predicted nucleic acid binding AN1-type Zn finger protein